MTDIQVEKIENPENRTLPVFQRVDALFERLQKRAFELFADRGFVDGHDLQDWLAAEHELCWPATELAEHPKKYVMSVALAGFEPEQIEVTASPRELIVHAAMKSGRRETNEKKGEAVVLWSEFRSNDVFRRVELAEPIDVSKVSASFANGLLTVIAEKAAKVPSRGPVAAAA